MVPSVERGIGQLDVGRTTALGSFFLLLHHVGPKHFISSNFFVDEIGE